MKSRSLTAMLVGAALSGCTDEVSNVRSPLPIDDIVQDANVDVAMEHDVASADRTETCEPAADEGPCSLLCDPDALIETYVPEGTCVHFLCTLRDGTRRSIGACHWP